MELEPTTRIAVKELKAVMEEGIPADVVDWGRKHGPIVGYTILGLLLAQAEPYSDAFN